MKKILFKSVLVITLALLSVSFFSSCSNSNESDIPEPTQTVSSDTWVKYEQYTGNSTNVKKVLDKLIELQFISKYTPVIPIYNSFAVNFEQTDVPSKDVEKVKAELITQANKHYEEALKKVNNFDFSTLFTESDSVKVLVKLIVKVDQKEYEATVKVSKP